MRRPPLLPLAAVLLTILPACDDDEGSSRTSADAFCEAWDAAASTGDDDELDAALAEVPSELADAAELVRDVGSGEMSAEEAAAADEIVDWTQLHCAIRSDGEGGSHLAAPIDADVGDLTFCGTTRFPLAREPSADTGMVLYGERAADDPYDGPMLGVFWNPVDVGSHVGDGDGRAVTVRGREGAAVPITVFQQVVLPELGTVVAWTEDDVALGVYGRSWPIERADELVALADRLEVVDGHYRLPADALPAGFGEVATGDPAALSIVFPPGSRYSARYQGDDGGLLTLHGLELDESEFEVFRFLALDVERGSVAGRDALVGNAWNEEGPAVITWREPDGLVVRIVALGVPLETTQQIAEQVRELSEDEWAQLVEAEDECERS